MAHLHGSPPGHGHTATHGPGLSGGALDRGPQSKRLWIVLSLTAVFMAAEVVGVVLSNSLALLADSGHMLADVGALAPRGTRLKMAAVVITVFREIEGQTLGYEANSDTDGKFVFFDLEPGPWKVLIEQPGYYPFRTTENIAADKWSRDYWLTS